MPNLGIDRRFSVALLGAARAITIALTCGLPWIFGGIDSWVRPYAMLAAAAIAMLTSLGIVGGLRRSAPSAFPWTAIPLGLAIAWGAFQLAPLSSEVVASTSPFAYRVKSLAASLAPASSPTDDRMSLSVAPHATRLDVSMLIFAGALHLAGWALFADSKSRRWLCGMLALNAAALAFFGLVQALTWNGEIYWSFPREHGGAPFASYVNRNNAGGYLLVGFAAAVGLACDAFSGTARHSETFGSSGDDASAVASPTLWLAGALGATIGAGIFASLSRGSMVSLAISSTVAAGAAVFAFRRVGMVGTVGFGVGLAGFVAIIIGVGEFGDRVGLRLLSTIREESFTSGRLPHWKGTLAGAPDFLFAGSGYGTYEYAYRPYETASVGVWFRHAENQYLEALIVGGLPGFAMLFGMLAFATLAVCRLLRSPSASARAFGVASALALAALAVHSGFDFGLYLPANLAVAALFLGATTAGPADVVRKREGKTALGRTRFSRFLASFAALVLAGGCVWGWSLWIGRSEAEAAIRFADEASESVLDADDLNGVVARLEQVVRRNPTDPNAVQRLAEAFVQRYRLAVRVRLIEDGLPPDHPAIDRFTLPAYFFEQVRTLERAGDVAAAARLRQERAVTESLLPASKYSRYAASLLPMSTRSSVLAAETSAAEVDGEKFTDQAIELAMLSAPSDPDVWFRCGVLHAYATREDEALRCFHQSLVLSEARRDDVLAFSAERFEPQRVVDKAIPEDPALILKLAEDARQRGQDAFVRMLAQKLLNGANRNPSTSVNRYAAAISALTGDWPAAVDRYRLAVEAEPRDATLRSEFAKALVNLGKPSEAYEQALWATRLDPNDPAKFKALSDYKRESLAAPNGG